MSREKEGWWGGPGTTMVKGYTALREYSENTAIEDVEER
jgi:hypothetical protein